MMAGSTAGVAAQPARRQQPDAPLVIPGAGRHASRFRLRSGIQADRYPGGSQQNLIYNGQSRVLPFIAPLANNIMRPKIDVDKFEHLCYDLRAMKTLPHTLLPSHHPARPSVRRLRSPDRSHKTDRKPAKTGTNVANHVSNVQLLATMMRVFATIMERPQA